jgi:hypothetical protein
MCSSMVLAPADFIIFWSQPLSEITSVSEMMFTYADPKMWSTFVSWDHVFDSHSHLCIVTSLGLFPWRIGVHLELLA